MFKIFFLLTLVFSCMLLAETKEINQMSQLEEAIGPIKSTDWILLDVDYTLIQPEHPSLQMSTIKQNKQRFRDELKKFTDDQKELIPVLMVTQVNNQLTDSSIPQLIQKWQKQNIPVIGFTAIDT